MLQSPHNLPIFNGEKLVVYGVLKSKEGSTKKMDCTAVLNGNMLGEKQEHKVPFTLDSSAAAPSLPVVHHLAAKALIADWESKYKEKKSIVDLSIESSVISFHTAFIAIDEESSEPVSGAMKTYDVKANLQRKRFDAFGGLAHATKSPRTCGKQPPAPRKELPTKAARKSAPARSLEQVCKKRKTKFTKSPTQRVLRSRAAPLAPSPPVTRSRWATMHSLSQTMTDRVSTNPVMSLITAQQVNGSWALNTTLAQLMGKSLHDLKSGCPIEMKEDVAGVWATVLAVSLLRAQYSSQQDEWELIAMKAESWLKKQSFPPGCTLEQLFQAAQELF